MKLDACLPNPPAPQFMGEEEKLRNYGLACARAGALAALDEAITTCEAVGLKNTIEGYFDVDESAECAAAIRRLRDTIAKGESK